MGQQLLAVRVHAALDAAGTPDWCDVLVWQRVETASA
jgi:hypothetical protein